MSWLASFTPGYLRSAVMAFLAPPLVEAFSMVDRLRVGGRT
jgi:hypothetical protein